MASVSRTAPLMMTPAMPTAMHCVIMISPIRAQVSSPLPSMTRTSPGRAIAIAAWIIRLSPARTSTVRAGPARRMLGARGAIRLLRAPRRPATSARMEEGKAAAAATSSGSIRWMSRMTSDGRVVFMHVLRLLMIALRTGGSGENRGDRLRRMARIAGAACLLRLFLRAAGGRGSWFERSIGRVIHNVYSLIFDNFKLWGMYMDFRDLRYFEVIAFEGNLARAAERLHRTQPALTKCIDRLEEDLGASLFEKDGRGMRLTAAGQVLVKRTRQMVIMAEDTAREMRDYAGGLQGTVRIGCVPTLAEHMMPQVFARLLAEAPEIRVTLVVGMNDNLLANLRDGELDLMVGPILDTDGEIVSEQIAEDTVVVMASEQHPIFDRPPTLARLLDYQWMLPAPTVASRQWLDQTFARHGMPRPRVQIESNVLNAILPILESTPLLGFVTRFNLVAGRARVREVVLAETQMTRRLSLSYRNTAYLSPVAARVADILRACGKQLLMG